MILFEAMIREKAVNIHHASVVFVYLKPHHASRKWLLGECLNDRMNKLSNGRANLFYMKMSILDPM